MKPINMKLPIIVVYSWYLEAKFPLGCPRRLVDRLGHVYQLEDDVGRLWSEYYMQELASNDVEESLWPRLIMVQKKEMWPTLRPRIDKELLVSCFQRKELDHRCIDLEMIDYDFLLLEGCGGVEADVGKLYGRHDSPHVCRRRFLDGSALWALLQPTPTGNQEPNFPSNDIISSISGKETSMAVVGTCFGSLVSQIGDADHSTRAWDGISCHQAYVMLTFPDDKGIVDIVEHSRDPELWDMGDYSISYGNTLREAGQQSDEETDSFPTPARVIRVVVAVCLERTARGICGSERGISSEGCQWRQAAGTGSVLARSMRLGLLLWAHAGRDADGNDTHMNEIEKYIVTVTQRTGIQAGGPNHGRPWSLFCKWGIGHSWVSFPGRRRESPGIMDMNIDEKCGLLYFVYRSNDASHAVGGGKLGPKWDGPYEVTEALGDGAYKLRSTDRTVLPRTWSIANLKKCYL
ncbi:hypothetical protein Tco_1351284 [Tanacetum coccineum]